MDQYTIQRLERVVEFESKCFPQDEELIEASKVLIKHLKGIWDIK